ncbi:hypothetical protein BDZ91DRAFT_759698 [Kalaharituber pfeilii]|nr:hypothetical protein BDZ91DRAFT_759698 [Kalaharituber pfeilii]
MPSKKMNSKRANAPPRGKPGSPLRPGYPTIGTTGLFPGRSNPADTSIAHTLGLFQGGLTAGIGASSHTRRESAPFRFGFWDPSEPTMDSNENTAQPVRVAIGEAGPSGGDSGETRYPPSIRMHMPQPWSNQTLHQGQTNTPGGSMSPFQSQVPLAYSQSNLPSRSTLNRPRPFEFSPCDFAPLPSNESLQTSMSNFEAPTFFFNPPPSQSPAVRLSDFTSTSPQLQTVSSSPGTSARNSWWDQRFFPLLSQPEQNLARQPQQQEQQRQQEQQEREHRQQRLSPNARKFAEEASILLELFSRTSPGDDESPINSELLRNAVENVKLIFDGKSPFENSSEAAPAPPAEPVPAKAAGVIEMSDTVVDIACVVCFANQADTVLVHPL